MKSAATFEDEDMKKRKRKARIPFYDLDLPEFGATFIVGGGRPLVQLGGILDSQTGMGRNKTERELEEYVDGVIKVSAQDIQGRIYSLIKNMPWFWSKKAVLKAIEELKPEEVVDYLMLGVARQRCLEQAKHRISDKHPVLKHIDRQKAKRRKRAKAR